MEKFTKFKIDIEKEIKSENFAQFAISPLERGFGTTIGNALRRVLLSSVPGGAVFAVRVPGITHEYQPLKGIMEDMVQIILNLKALAIRIDENIVSDSELENLTLEKWPVLKISKPKGTVRARDIICPAGFEIINKDLVILTATEQTDFEFEIFTTRGRGFRTFQENKEIASSFGLIPIDSNFSPIVRVNFQVEETKTEKRGTNDRLVVEIATNGTIDPASALAISAKIISSHLDPIISVKESIREVEMMREKAREEKASALSVAIEELGVTSRTYNSLKRAGIQTIQELTNKSRSELNELKSLGKKSVKEIIIKLTERGIKLRD